MKIKVLMLIPELGYGGAEKSFIRLSKLLATSYCVTIVVFKRHYATGGYSYDSDDITVPVIILDSSSDDSRVKRWWNRWKKLRKLKRENDISISFLTGANILNASVFFSGKTVTSLRGSRQYDPGLSSKHKFFYKYLIDPITFAFSDKVISVSDGLTYELGKNLDIWTRKKIETIEVFIDSKKMIETSKEDIEKEICILEKSPLIISTGRLSQEKGFKHLITVFSSVKKYIPAVKLMLIGDGPQFEELCKQCEIEELSYSLNSEALQESDVIFLGYKKDPIRYYKIANVFVLSSMTEGFPNGVIEALASGIPVVAANSPWGARSILSKNPTVQEPYPSIDATKAEYGLLMPRIDKEIYRDIWTKALVEILENDLYLRANSTKGIDRIKELDLSIVGKKWIDLVSRLGEN